MKKQSLNGPKFGFCLVLGLTCLCLGFFITIRFLRAVTVGIATIDLPLEDERWVSFYDQQQKEIAKVFVREQTKIRISQMPTTLQRAFVQRREPQFYGSSKRLKDLPLVFVTEFRAFLGLNDPGYYNRDISATLAYNIFLIHKQTQPHRLDEAILAYKIERKYRKEEILEFYLNNIYFGEGIFGVEAAANYYFGKSAAKLQAHEIAFLVGLATDTLSPEIYQKELLLQDPKAAKASRDQVLEEMARGNAITPKQAGEFRRKDLGVVSY